VGENIFLKSTEKGNTKYCISYFIIMIVTAKQLEFRLLTTLEELEQLPSQCSISFGRMNIIFLPGMISEE
jgi:hypothetical protein